jgi:DNA polymerase III delta subunit
MVEPVGEVRRVEIKRQDLEPWLLHRAAQASLELTSPAARALVETVGEDAGQLDAAVQQLASAFAGVAVGPAQVHLQFRGLGEQKTWDLCDRAFGKDLPGAIRSLRAIEESGDEALMVLGGIASRVRDLIKVRSLPDRLPPAKVAKEAGLRFDWQARRYQQQARNFTVDDLVRIHDEITEADRSLKSGGTATVVMPALIVSIAG